MFPDKRALLFHVARQTWERQLTVLSPLLTRPGDDHADKFGEFIREYFLVEAEEAPLRGALRAVSIDVRSTPEFEEIVARGLALAKGFLVEALPPDHPDDPDVVARFMVTLTTSFAERITDDMASRPDLIRQATMLSRMFASHLGIRNRGTGLAPPPRTRRDG